ncbi:beta-lactamase/transpeptidase-like protein [Lasiosphaeris hirsuta]|uniref:Beta-lactamase/transpeptidase-like protein n=1 Tax=Lasiosphaeris hirsuta TaxID=260670 RepID=A0AA40BD36_9PEZI|nr:beta-lactamase/transpeptidase-like protein [Lasiosphaeris hirsuta]
MADGNIESALEAAIASGKINGAVILATDANGTFVYNRALGERTLLSGEKQPQRTDDMLYLASATKLIATIAALQCVDDGLLTLAGSLSDIAPELASKQVLTGFSDDGTPHLVPAARPITIEMLLAHTSGVAYDFFVPKLAKWRQQNEAPLAEGARRPVEEAFGYPLAFQPGEGWMYGPGLDWAGRIVERVTGGTLGDHVRRRICGPLGIPGEEAQFYPVVGEGVRARLVDLNPDDPECLGRAVLGGGGDMNRRSKGDFGGHGLFMTGPGYLEVLKSLLVNDGKLLRPETVENMFENRIGPEAEAGHRDAVDGVAGVFFRVGTEPGSKVGHGLGGLVPLENTEGWYSEKTITWGGGMTFSWFCDRKNGLCGLGAIQAPLPMDVKTVSDLKQTFRHDMYRKMHAAWKEQA